jgi:formylglycine-generating enzyme required for sulfatase activity
MVLIPGGGFQMGDALDGDGTAPVHAVTISDAYYLDANLVSGSLWSLVVTGYAQAHGYAFGSLPRFKAPSHPVYVVTWYDAVKWCNARSEMEGVAPVYYTDAGLTTVYRSGDAAPYVDPAAKGYRLPTEAQWEKAARGGLVGQRFPWGNTISESQANYFGCPGCATYDLGPLGYNAAYAVDPAPYTSPGGSFPPNGYHVYDMAGNLIEWCWDWYSDTYYAPDQTDPQGPASGARRVLRGGSWIDFSSGARTAIRSNSAPNYSDLSIGFRSARGL